MKMGNTVPRAGFERTSLAFQASVLSFHDIGSLMSPRPSVYVAIYLRGQCRLLHIYHQYQIHSKYNKLTTKNTTANNNSQHTS